MKKAMLVVMATVFVAGLSMTVASAFAGGTCCANKEKAGAEASMSGACATKSSLASVLKSAPGTTMKYERVKGGEFCSDEHRADYSKEADRAALRRLIETPGAPMRSIALLVLLFAPAVARAQGTAADYDRAAKLGPRTR